MFSCLFLTILFIIDYLKFISVEIRFKHLLLRIFSVESHSFSSQRRQGARVIERFTGEGGIFAKHFVRFA